MGGKAAEDEGGRRKRVRWSEEKPTEFVLKGLGPANPWGQAMANSIHSTSPVVHADAGEEDTILSRWMVHLKKTSGKGGEGGGGMRKRPRDAGSDGAAGAGSGDGGVSGNPDASPPPSSSSSSSSAAMASGTTAEVVKTADGNINEVAALVKIVPHLKSNKKFGKASALLAQLIQVRWSKGGVSVSSTQSRSITLHY